MPPTRGQSRYHDRREDDFALVESFDGFAPLRNGLRRIAADRGEWAGIPMPLEDERLVIEPTYPHAKELSAMGKAQDEPLTDDVVLRNAWWSDRLRAEVVIWNEGGKVCFGTVPRPHHVSLDLCTLGCSQAWGIEQESAAVHLLGSHVRHHQMKQYLLTGMFLETSQRSRVTYLFRRLKPTLALDARSNDAAPVRILAALCMHPIGYYDASWAGAMCPTDDVLAHLMLMRGDEHLFWKRSNQHSPGRPEAGL